MTKIRILALAAILVANALVLIWLPSASRADSAEDCFSEDIERRLVGCTELIDGNDQTADLALAHAMRGLAYSLKGQYEDAIGDFSAAIGRRPGFAVAYNNRAWAYFRWGKVKEGLPDIEKSIELDPASPYAYDTRAHMRQSLGDAAAALRDYDRALFYGRQTMTRLYQCGLTDRGLYSGPLDGAGGPELFQALEKCSAQADCDPLPADEKCH